MTGVPDPRADQPVRDVSERLPTPRVVWLITAVFGCLLLLYSILFPSYRGPDEPHHVDLTLYVQETWRYPDYGERFIGTSVIESLQVVRFHERSRDLAARRASPRNSRPPLVDVIPESSSPNQLSQHPPLYYYTLASVNEVVDLVTPGDALSRPFDRTVWILRLFNLVLLLPVPAITYRLARHMGARHEVGVAAAVMLLGVPQLTHIGAVVNNDNLLVLLVAVLTLLLLRIAEGDLTVRTSGAAGVVAGLALLTKASALFIPVWIGLAYLVAARGTKQRGRALRHFGLAGGLALLVGGWWWVRNQILYGSVLVGALGGSRVTPEGFTPDLVWWIRRFTAWIARRFWGWFGWFDVRMPLWTVVAGMAVVLGGVALLLLWRREDARATRAHASLLLVPTVVIGVLVAIAAYRGYLRTGDTPSIQGRYLFPGVAGLVAVTMLGLQRLFRRVEYMPLVVLTFAAVMQAVGVVTALHFYWAPRRAGLLWDEARSMVAWSPWPGELAVVFGIVSLVVGSLMVRDIVAPILAD